MDKLRQYYNKLLSYRYDTYTDDKEKEENKLGLELLKELKENKMLKDFNLEKNIFKFLKDYDYYDEPLNALIKFKEEDWYGVYLLCDYLKDENTETDVFSIFKFKLKEENEKELVSILDNLNENIQKYIDEGKYDNILETYDKILKEHFDDVHTQLLFRPDMEYPKYIDLEKYLK